MADKKIKVGKVIKMGRGVKRYIVDSKGKIRPVRVHRLKEWSAGKKRSDKKAYIPRLKSSRYIWSPKEKEYWEIGLYGYIIDDTNDTFASVDETIHLSADEYKTEDDVLQAVQGELKIRKLRMIRNGSTDRIKIAGRKVMSGRRKSWRHDLEGRIKKANFKPDTHGRKKSAPGTKHRRRPSRYRDEFEREGYGEAMQVK